MVALPPSSTPAPWRNQMLALYHGTVDANVGPILSGVQVSQGRRFTDFGQGFYTTTVDRQAESWAWQLSQRCPGTQPAVIRFDVDRDQVAMLECLWFVRGGFDAANFWSLIFYCRRGGTAHSRGTGQGWYDVVIGPVAASWRQRLTIYDADQISFHTDRAAQLLNQSSPRRVK